MFLPILITILLSVAAGAAIDHDHPKVGDFIVGEDHK